jgi:predicted HD superfamily hydrolase involved in NAD metabolism
MTDTRLLLPTAEAYARERLSDKRFAHTLRVAEEAERLSNRHDLEGRLPHRARLAALLHDAAREMDDGALLRTARRLGVTVGEAELEKPNLLHGPVAAGLAEKELGVTDAGVLEAIRAHTTGEPGMGALALVVYVADKVEPGRDYPGVEDLRALAEKNLREATRGALQRAVSHNESRGRETHPLSLETLRWLEKG